jgi:hypothetical protein
MTPLQLALSYAVLTIVGLLLIAMWLIVIRREYGRMFRQSIEADQRERERVGL